MMTEQVGFFSGCRYLLHDREHFITLRGRDAFEYQTALETLAPLGLSISQATTLMADHQRQLGGRGTVQEAIQYFLENRPQRSPDITVREVVDQLLALKQKEGEVGKIYVRDLRLRLNKFAEAFHARLAKSVLGTIFKITSTGFSPACSHSKVRTVHIMYDAPRFDARCPHHGVGTVFHFVR